MSLALQVLSLTKNPISYHFPSPSTNLSTSLKFHFPPLNLRPHLPNQTLTRPQFASAKFGSSFDDPYEGSRTAQFNGISTSTFDAVLSVFEFLSLAASAAASVYIVIRVQRGATLRFLESRVVVWQCVALVGGLVAGAAMRRRQWSKICGVEHLRWPNFSGANLLERVEKLEDDLRSSTTIVQGLARRLEKLGIRFRVTRKALKEPMAETAALVQKNSEATQALAAQEDILEKELGEIHKVLLAMQEQQQKQLDLILAIGKAGKFWESKNGRDREQKASTTTSKPREDGAVNKEINQVGNPVLHKEANLE